MKMIRYLRLVALSLAAIAVPVAVSPSLERNGPQLYPICAPGRIIYAPFPGGEKKETPSHKGNCHAAGFVDRMRLVQLKPKNR